MVDIPILAKVDDMQKVEDIHMIVAHMSMQRIMQKVSVDTMWAWSMRR